MINNVNQITSVLFLLVFVLSGCASTKDPKMPYEYSFTKNDKKIMLTEEKIQSAPAPPVIEKDIKIVTYTTPNLTQREKDSQPKSVMENNIKYTITPMAENFISGAAVTYNFVPNQMYQIFTAVNQVTNILLAPGEALTSDIVCADEQRFTTGLTYSGSGENRVYHVLITPLSVGKETTLFIHTNKRFYTFLVSSFDKTYMPIVNFTYPMDAMRKYIAQQQGDKLPMTNSGSTIPVGDFSNLDFNYEILPLSKNKPNWMPSIVFNDGIRTYINFASAFRAAAAPVLFAVNEKDERFIVNYRVSGSYYIVDQILTKAELLVDANAGNIVVIKHRSVK